MNTALATPPKAKVSDDIVLTAGQQAALEKLTAFLLNPDQRFFVLCGYSGTGKTTLIRILMERMQDLLNTIELMSPGSAQYDVELTATTNKAAENFGQLTGRTVKTIHSFLGLRVRTDYTTRKTSLVPARRDEYKSGYILMIDEASFIDGALLHWIKELTPGSKVIFMGDPAQLAPVDSPDTPVFTAGFPTAMLTEVVRQAEGNPIVQLATQFRETVRSGVWTPFKPDGKHVIHLPRHLFEQEIIKEFTRPDWKFRDSKVLAWTNQTVMDYNHVINDLVKGQATFQPGDYAVCNSYILGGGTSKSIRTDELVMIDDISEPTEVYGVPGRLYAVRDRDSYFMPDSLEARNAAYKRLKAQEEFQKLEHIDQWWIDLRPSYSCTVNKSQGSTYDRVYIDLADVGRCRDQNQLARMLYVGSSRPRFQVFFTGDL